MSEETRSVTDEEKRFAWIKTLEAEYTFEKEGAKRFPPLAALQLYADATNAFRYGSYFGYFGQRKNLSRIGLAADQH
ncbi:MAG: hypothetical protein ACXACI_12505 [Candidatus Hodarchaeales archaeon]